jgi:hypothetical protein
MAPIFVDYLGSRGDAAWHSRAKSPIIWSCLHTGPADILRAAAGLVGKQFNKGYPSATMLICCSKRE